MSTAKISAPMFGDRLYQQRAQAALPLLVRQAKAGKPIFYSDLAEELGMPNPRNLNYVLGSIGQSMALLSDSWDKKVPPIQCLVVNRATGLPGEGIGWFLVKEEDFNALPLRQKRAMIEAELQHIFSYPYWSDVLAELSLPEVAASQSTIVAAAARGGFGGGEGTEHKALKLYVARNPAIVGLPPSSAPGVSEHPLPSGDCLDVSFQHRKIWVAAEVKSSISSEADIARGLFQCVKYLAVMEAVQIATERPANARAVLVLGGPFPPSLITLRNLLGVEVIDAVSIK
ncbi:MAG TPA: hypothetical protein VF800_07540 [Telluria sp.]|jgi:hypothetical protein